MFEELPLVEIFGQEEIAGLFQNIYAFLYPAMPILMISLAISFAGVFVYVFRKIFNIDTFLGSNDEFEYKEKNKDYD